MSESDSQIALTFTEAHVQWAKVAGDLMGRHLGYDLKKCLLVARTHIARCAKDPATYPLQSEIAKKLRFKPENPKLVPMVPTQNSKRVVNRTGPGGPPARK